MLCSSGLSLMAVALYTVSFALESYVWIMDPWGQGEAEGTLEDGAVYPS